MEKYGCKSPIENGHVNKLPLPKLILNPSNGYSIPNMKDSQKKGKKRPLKLVYGHDARLAQIPVNSSFKTLSDVVGEVFPMLKGFLIMYKYSNGALMNITSSSELRLAESLVDKDTKPEIDEKRDSTFSVLRLLIIEVNPEKAPPVLEVQQEDEPECKAVELPLDFMAHCWIPTGTHPDSHIDPDFTGEELHALFFFNFGNLLMCEAHEKMKMIDETMDEQLYDWVREKYKKAKCYYEITLLTKPDFFRGLLALGQLQFEMAKLRWSFVLAQKSDLSKWDPTKMMLLFDRAEKNLTAATKAWEKMEEQRANEDKKDEVVSSQIHLFWGNMLFVRSHIECFLDLSGWDTNRDAALLWFKLAGLSDGEKEEVLRSHCCWNIIEK